MNRLTKWSVGGMLANGERFSIVVEGWYGYDAMRNAAKVVGKIKTGCAVRIEGQSWRYLVPQKFCPNFL